MKNEETKRQPVAPALILHSSFFLLHFPVLAKGEITSLSGAGMTAVFSNERAGAAGQFGRGAGG